MNDYFTFFYVKHFELPLCMKCAIQINLPCLALPCPPGLLYVWSVWKPLFGGGSVTNLVAIPPHGLLHHTTAAHHSTSDYNSHHSLHSQSPLITPLHYHTAVTYRSFALVVLPHLHLIHTPTYKQHTSMHTLRSLVYPHLTFPSVFPECVSLCLPGLPIRL